jgi:hypothetical protein
VHVVPRPCKTIGDPSLSSMFAEVLHVVGAEVATDATEPNTATAPCSSSQSQSIAVGKTSCACRTAHL